MIPLKKKISLLFFALLAMLWAVSAEAVEITIPAVTAEAGQAIEVPVTLDEIDNLAGVKLVLNYDPETLTYKSGMKTKETDSLMHIVNDKKPGVLIIVMAGAKGIQGKNLPIFKLSFEVKKEIKENRTTKISITEFQLMGDDLKERKATVNNHPITIKP